MLTSKEIEYIKNNVSKKHFNVAKLIAYLNTHDIVDASVFQEVCLKSKNDDTTRLPDFKRLLFMPVEVKHFLHRIPFYFYVSDDQNELPMTANEFILASIMKRKKIYSEDSLKMAAEDAYTIIEDIFVNYGITAKQLYSYFDPRKGKNHPFCLSDWYEYLHLCKKYPDKFVYFPDAFNYTYNVARETAGMEPIIYDIKGYSRFNNTITINGILPVDPDGNPVMRWIGIILKNPGKVTGGPKFNGQDAHAIDIEITPKTELYARNLYNNDSDDENHWYRLYAGPLTMEFDPGILKKRRKKMNMTQSEVAEAVGTTLRTYQNWETGVTIPDSLHMLRLMNWLDISDPLATAKWNADWDTEM